MKQARADPVGEIVKPLTWRSLLVCLSRASRKWSLPGPARPPASPTYQRYETGDNRVPVDVVDAKRTGKGSSK